MAPRQKTADIIAEKHGVSPATIERAAAYARNVDAIANIFGNEARTQLLSAENQLSRQAVADMAAQAAEAKAAGKTFDELKRAVEKGADQHHLTRCTGENEHYM